MNPLRDFLDRFAAHESITYALIRVFLGFALFIRGVIFITDQEALMTLITSKGLDWFFPVFLVHYITLAHLVGGLMLIFGLLTRASAIAQIPILFGAVFFVHLGEGLFAAGQSLELAALVLFLLVVIFLGGSGDYSLDHYFFHRKKQKRAEDDRPGRDLPPDGIIAPGKPPVHRTYTSEPG